MNFAGRILQNNRTQFMKTKEQGNKFSIDRMMLMAPAGHYVKLRTLCEDAARNVQNLSWMALSHTLDARKVHKKVSDLK